MSAPLEIFSPEKAAGYEFALSVAPIASAISRSASFFCVSCHTHNDKNEKFKVFLSWIHGMEVFEK